MARKVHKRRNQRELAPAQAGAACGKQAVRRDFVPENKKRRVTLNKEDSFDSPEEKYATGGERSDSKWPKGTSRTCPHCDFSTAWPAAMAIHSKTHAPSEKQDRQDQQQTQLEQPKMFTAQHQHPRALPQTSADAVGGLQDGAEVGAARNNEQLPRPRPRRRQSDINLIYT